MRFEDLDVWKRSYYLTVKIFKYFKKCKDIIFKQQITKSALSIPSNIAEGYERESNKEFIRFLYIAKGSCGELRTQISLAIDVGYIEKDIGENLLKEVTEISYMLSSLIKTRKSF